MPSTVTLTVLSGSWILCAMRLMVPISWISLGEGSLVLERRCRQTQISPPCSCAYSRAWMDLLRPTKRGTSIEGKTRISRSGSSGRFFIPYLVPEALNVSGSSALLVRPTSQCRGSVMVDDVAIDDHVGNRLIIWGIIHDLEHGVLQDSTQAACPCLLFSGLHGDRAQCVLLEDEVDAVDTE